MQLQTDEQREKRACFLTAGGSISKAVWALLIVGETGLQPSSHGDRALGLIRLPRKVSRRRGLLGVVEGTREQGRSRTGLASLPHVKLAPMSALGPSGERQEHFDALVSFAGARQKRRLFRGLDFVTTKWATGDLPEECRFFFNTQLMFLKKEKDTISKQFGDDEWIRSLTEARETTSDVPEDSV